MTSSWALESTMYDDDADFDSDYRDRDDRDRDFDTAELSVPELADAIATADREAAEYRDYVQDMAELPVWPTPEEVRAYEAYQEQLAARAAVARAA